MPTKKILFTAQRAAEELGEHPKLVEVLMSDSDNVNEGELRNVLEGERQFKVLTVDGLESIRNLIADLRSWDGGILSAIRGYCTEEEIDAIMTYHDENAPSPMA
ncbi:hypothetical protein LAZ40_09665 [Cereibacter sphaeroides]|uniref:hypothetical protein n=1 Tax=Cereibacter sphaeroides TaxID=1063 RepID=UPI001F17429E|nr:hypothetical protein [Cereibacter sphaeroides]MCE6959317.1 hypothetical protein [Cereibacter sphaeroides]MCE6972909.1 hypothetical protein [Cereibacter sphaeroides]